ncbi:hypothetical protein WBW39_07210 [Pectobacterium versatile]|uniref:hypothetical protein n=1 Tax=Pectobacterium versatile TaxID=2488639 RepID=UPI000B7BCEC6|nr:hypothetical protein [Pectobacterium versatile]ASN87014.1 Hypothetical protein SCC1_3612 [Pectobacterium versatile]MBQ4762399.1 hypothetical protein [Pectobacterium versatile]RJL51585.1 hypothetical protein D5076_21490 [Pectobacterium versatile]RJL56209.1 hypothetical protein D5073_08185 [Pectobacterium versatile]RJL65870.1 hypothetical protein D5080_03375 [Pectobacterium versatile]
MHRLYKKAITYLLSKDFLVTLLVLSIMLAIFWYMLWASQLSRRTILIEALPDFTIYLTFGIVSGIIFAGRAFYSRSVKKKLKHTLEMFLGGFVLGFLSIVNSFDVYVYLFPDDVINYTSDYEIVFPGPPKGKTSRCEAGLWIRDVHTGQLKQLCTSRETLFKKRRQGMNELWVTARINKLGTYIVDYRFTYK